MATITSWAIRLISRRITHPICYAVMLATITEISWWLWGAPPLSEESLRQQARTYFEEGNYERAYEAYRQLALTSSTASKQVAHDYAYAVQALQNWGRIEQFDAFAEEVAKIHASNWRVLKAVAKSYTQMPHVGTLINQQFERGHRRGGGRWVSSEARDRGRSLQLFHQAYQLANSTLGSDDHTEYAELCLEFAQTLMTTSAGFHAWKLQELTDFATLPDYQMVTGGRRGWLGYEISPQGAPVDDHGQPIFFNIPATWQTSRNDGERWRYLLEEAAKRQPRLRNQVDLLRAQFLLASFGVQTLLSGPTPFYPLGIAEDKRTEDETSEHSSPFVLHTLRDEETIARLAVGVRRITLPDEHNPIKVLQEILKRNIIDEASNAACDTLAQSYEDRRQYRRAAEVWKLGLERFGDEGHRAVRWQQIVGNWGRFETTRLQPAGLPQTVTFRYRNARKVHLTARVIHLDTLLQDIKNYLLSRPENLEWERVHALEQLGFELVNQRQEKYLGEQVAEWSVNLTPREDHADRWEHLSIPLQKAGAYFLTARVDGGNTSHLVYWLADTVLAHKNVDGKTWYFVADAITGAPLARAHVEFLGWTLDHRPTQRGERPKLLIKNFAEYTNAEGQIVLDSQRVGNGYEWMAIVRHAGRLAFLGFQAIWPQPYSQTRWDQLKSYVVTDRPVYRPNQQVHFKAWVTRAAYDHEGRSPLAGKTVTWRIRDPLGEIVREQQAVVDEYGGLSGEYSLPKGTRLGVYSLVIEDLGGGHFRVEEYKKPEFEVLIHAPEHPVKLGDAIEAKITARYYFGSPVGQAKVRYKIERRKHTTRWYPPSRWDWLYGSGYGWLTVARSWYPDHDRWACVAPPPSWWHAPAPPPELVADNEQELSADGSLTIKIDTLPAKELFGDSDHSYHITAEVTDASRRVIVGQGHVLATRRPFQVTVWLDRGHYQVGDTVEVGVRAHTADQRPVSGRGELLLYQVHINEQQQPIETEVQRWEFPSENNTTNSFKMHATQPGQYRLACRFTSAEGLTEEGAVLFLVRGPGFDGRDLRFNDLEIIPDAREYRPGDKVRLMINTNRPNSTVLLFLRPQQGVYLPPQLIRLQGKSTVAELVISRQDQPNIFIEACTVSNGQWFQEVREIAVPPESRLLNVAIEPQHTEYPPGGKAKLLVKVQDSSGRPWQGPTVVTVYDRSLEYIAGGSNVPDIQSAFWHWKRHHHPNTSHNLDRYSYNLVKPGDSTLLSLGSFGDLDIDLLGRDKSGIGEVRQNEAVELQRGRGGGLRRAANGMTDAAAGAPLAATAEFAGLADRALRKSADDISPAPAEAPVTVRQFFADAAYWNAALLTDEDGKAELEFALPDDLTAWKVRAWAVGQGTRVGEDTQELITRKRIMVRLQAPRFFVERDEVTLSAVIHNEFSQEKTLRIVLELAGDYLQPLDETTSFITVPSRGIKRVDWRVKVRREGMATIRVSAFSDEESDALQQTFPVKVHGALRQESWSGVIRPDQTAAKIIFEVPAQRRPELSRLELRFSPTLAGALIDALPYLVEYPYGCTEQTLNRFLPTVIVHRILREMPVDLARLREQHTNLNPQEVGDPLTRARGWQRYLRNPVFDADEIETMTKEGVERLSTMQLADGGWGWFGGFGERSYPHTTAVVTHGLLVAKQHGIALVPDVLERGISWLQRYQHEQLQMLTNAAGKKQPWKTHCDPLDAFVFLVLTEADQAQPEMREYLFRDRLQLPVYARAMFALALHMQQQLEQRDRLLENIAQFMVEDDENQTAYLRLPEPDIWWYWYGSEIEANAWFLKLLTRVNPQDRRASRLVKYLLNNRKHATYWNSTRDTALCIEALAEFWKASGEDRPEMTVELWLNGTHLRSEEITPSVLLSFNNTLILEGESLTSGRHTLELKRKGRGPLYYNVYLTNFSLQDFIPSAGLEIRVDRRLYLLKRIEHTEPVAGSRGQMIRQQTEKFARHELVNLSQLNSGELLEVELIIESKNDYEYLLFEDYKPAGCEPVNLRSGYGADALGAYVEYRDDRTAFFIRHLPRGRHALTYRLRAEIPGIFHALPTQASAMYAPELRGNSDEFQLRISDIPHPASRAED